MVDWQTEMLTSSSDFFKPVHQLEFTQVQIKILIKVHLHSPDKAEFLVFNFE